MKLQHRAVLSAAFFILGMEFIYQNMQGTRSASPRNPTWLFVSMIHSGLVVVLFMIMAIVLLAFCYLIYEHYREVQQKAERERKSELKRQEEIALWEEQRRERKLEEEARLKQKQIEENRRKHLEQENLKRRKQMSADEVSKSALDDFL